MRLEKKWFNEIATNTQICETSSTSQKALFQNKRPSNPFIYAVLSKTIQSAKRRGTNIRHARYSLLITKTYAGVQLEFGRPSKEENKRLFDELFKYKTQIETAFGKPLTWDRSDDTISSRIGCYVEGVNIFNNEDWDVITNFLVANIINFEVALRQHLINVKQTLSVTEESETE